VRLYSDALARAADAPAAFAAVLHANRAAAHEAQGRLPEAIADCLRASALDPGYARAHSRLGGLLARARHAEGAVAALERLAALPGGGGGGPGVAGRLAEARALERRRAVTDHYALLGLPRGATAADVRGAYKRSALAHHPDKALAQCRFADRLGSLGAPVASAAQARHPVERGGACREVHWCDPAQGWAMRPRACARCALLCAAGRA
jgi:DnaJ family protein C protein 7